MPDKIYIAIALYLGGVAACWATTALNLRRVKSPFIWGPMRKMLFLLPETVGSGQVIANFLVPLLFPILFFLMLIFEVLSLETTKLAGMGLVYLLLAVAVINGFWGILLLALTRSRESERESESSTRS